MHEPRAITVIIDARPDGERGVGPLPRTLQDRFTLGEQLGAGGMGTVVEAHDREVGRTVAVKRLVAIDDARQVALLAEEARIQGRLDHPAIPAVFELGRDRDGRAGFAMRRVGGTTLSTILAERNAGTTTHSTERLLRIFADACQAIAHAHTRGVLHCDLKPSNVMVDADDRVYVIDWGIATLYGADREAVARRTGGTLGYMAPEQLEGSAPLGPALDVYALGCILFEILAREPLHLRSEGLLRSVLAGADGRPSQRKGGAGTSAPLDAICQRATARAPADRYASAGELAREVTDWLDLERDGALREQLGAAHLAAASAALAEGTVDGRERALGLASRAVALTPHDPAAAALVRTLLADDDIPVGARAEIAELDRKDERELARAAAWSYLGFLLFPLINLVQGHADLAATLLTLGAWLGLEVLAIAAMRGRGPSAWLWWSVALLTVECTVFSRYLSPFLVTPALTALTAAGAMMHPRIRRGPLVVAALALPTLAPFALELSGWLARTVEIDHGRLYLRSAVSEVHRTTTMLGMLATSIALLLVAAVIGRLVAVPAHRARRQLAAQAWHLEHLVAAGEAPRRGRSAP
ncbi:MAG: serine/threonine protein kinase [Deltaproteobacteria bacterium]|nr:serine/threonine protein kinase [Deltaproteobacteria bacterium]